MISRLQKIQDMGINDADYEVAPIIDGKQHICPFYSRWKSMLQRVFSLEHTLKKPSYTNSTVCDEWLLFSNFRKWMITQDWENKALDKDIIKYNNLHYSPDTCCFVTLELNNLLCGADRIRGKYPKGVHFDKSRNKYAAKISYNNKTKFLGRHDSIGKAHRSYLTAKYKIILNNAIAQTNPTIKKGLLNHCDEICKQFLGACITNAET